MAKCLLCGNSESTWYDLAFVFDHKSTLTLGDTAIYLCPECYEHLCCVKLIEVQRPTASVSNGRTSFEDYIDNQISKARGH